MKIGVIISSNDAETCWNALRYANFSLGQKDEVKVFLAGKGVEYQAISTEMCPINTMKDMHEIVKESDKIVTF